MQGWIRLMLVVGLLATLPVPGMIRLLAAPPEPMQTESVVDPKRSDPVWPSQDGTLTPYAQAGESPLNRLQRLLFVASLVPEEVGGEVDESPTGGKESAQPWYFVKRKGEAGDERVFGGDVRISPRIIFAGPDEAASFESLLIETCEQVLASDELVRSTPLTKLLLQWDVLSVWWRWEQRTDVPPAALQALARVIEHLAMDDAEYASLPTGWPGAGEFVNSSQGLDADIPYLPVDLLEVDKQKTLSSDSSPNDWLELDRRSSKLFVSPQSLRASRVFLRKTNDPHVTAIIEGTTSPAESDVHPASRLETAMVLSVLGLSRSGRIVATPVIDEIRVRVVYGKDESVDAARTTSRDGSTLWLYLLDRTRTREAGEPRYRMVRNDAAGLFPEYGTAKHTTYAAQCTLCHRLTNSGKQAPYGIRSLSSYAEPTVIHDPSQRLRLAEEEAIVIASRLRERLASTRDASLSPATFKPGGRSPRSSHP